MTQASEVERIAAHAKRLTKLRKLALAEIAEAGDEGLGFGRCSLQARRYLLELGLTERLPHRGGMFDAVRERLTPLGLSVRNYLKEHHNGD